MGNIFLSHLGGLFILLEQTRRHLRYPDQAEQG